MTGLDIHPVPCPMPDCGEELGITWTLYLALYPEDLDRDSVIEPEDRQTGCWQIGCLAGHILVLPLEEEPPVEVTPTDLNRLRDCIDTVRGRREGQ